MEYAIKAVSVMKLKSKNKIMANSFKENGNTFLKLEKQDGEVEINISKFFFWFETYKELISKEIGLHLQKKIIRVMGGRKFTHCNFRISQLVGIQRLLNLIF